MHRRPWVVLVLSFLTVPGGAFLQADDGAVDELARGIQQVQDGDLEGAVTTLDAAVQKLAAIEPSRPADLARAHFYKGVALVGLLQEEPAKASFREALAHDPYLRVRSGEFPDRVVRVFEAARRGISRSVMKRPSGAPKKAGIGTGAVLAIAGGVALAAGGVAAVASGAAAPNRPPTGSISVTPPGQAIVGVTEMGFSATGSDPDGDPLTFTWNFGDGSTATGPNATHVFGSEGTFQVSLTINDSFGSTSLATNVSVRSLTGTWRRDNFGILIYLSQTGGRLNGSYEADYPSGAVRYRASGFVVGEVAAPRTVRFSIEYEYVLPAEVRGQVSREECALTGNNDLRSLSGTLYYGGEGRSAPITWTRVE